MARKRRSRSWIDRLKSLFEGKQHSHPISFRRLSAEQLEDRSVLSTASMADVESISLAAYLDQQRDQLGPIAPTYIAFDDGSSFTDSQPPALPTQLLLSGLAEGEDDPPPEDPPPGNQEDPSDPPPSDPPPEDPPPEDPPPEDPPSDPTAGNPTIGETEVTTTNGTVTINGILSDDGGVGNLSISVDNGTPNIFINEDGSFTINITNTEGYNIFTITVTDADGNTTTYTVEYPS
jgi:hypothetical protein